MPVKKFNRSIRDALFQQTRAAVQATTRSLIGQCLEFAWHGYQILKSYPGMPRTIIQAGSAQWPCVAPELDDGVSPTHFAYEWHANDPLIAVYAAGALPVLKEADRWRSPLPEIHIWLAIPSTGELIDFTTGLWPATSQALLGLDWRAPTPPDYFWDFGSRLPDGVRYGPERSAIDFILTVLAYQGRKYP